MGTKADFYLQKGISFTWLGSISQNAFPEEMPLDLLMSVNEDDFIKEFKNYTNNLKSFKPANDGWPWPWKNSSLTDFIIIFKETQVYISIFGSAPIDILSYFKQKEYLLILEEKRDKSNGEEFDQISDEIDLYIKTIRNGKKIDFPDMIYINTGLKQ